ncbi:MAG: hypothetical protein ABL970_17825 [Nitrospira sp.]
MITQDEQHATTLALYKIFKEEVYRRRDQMMRWTAIGAGSLVMLLLIALLVPSVRLLTVPARLLLASGTLLLALTFAVMIWQQHDRHRQAKQQLITLEHALGLFEDHHRPDHHPVYPAHWQTDWAHDRSLVQYLAILTVLTAITLFAIILPAQ